MWKYLSEIPSYLAIAFAGVATLLVGDVVYTIAKTPNLGGAFLLAIATITIAGLLFFTHRHLRHDSHRGMLQYHSMEMRAGLFANPGFLEATSDRQRTLRKLLERTERFDASGHTIMIVPTELVPEFERRINEFSKQW